MAIKLNKLKEEKKKNKLMFQLKGSTEVFANTIRRLILEEVPTLAIEDVEIKENSSALYDEMLALRLGLIPIKTDLKSYRLPLSKEEVEQKNAQCTVQMTLKSSRKGYVYAEEAESRDPKCVFVFPKMPVIKLLPKQKVDVTMTAVLGQGKEHTKWAPGWAYYKKELVVKADKAADAGKIVKSCTDGVFALRNNKLVLNQAQVYESNLLEYYAELHKGVTLEDSGNIIFTVEGWGQLSCKEMLAQSADILLKKAEEFEGLLK